jgi:hypothetical protein
MSNYRIIEVRKNDVIEHYKVQKKFLGLVWLQISIPERGTDSVWSEPISEFTNERKAREAIARLQPPKKTVITKRIIEL